MKTLGEALLNEYFLTNILIPEQNLKARKAPTLLRIFPNKFFITYAQTKGQYNNISLYVASVGNG